ncbi:MAG: FAD-dependent oxidoreductase [Chloroflexi bacterium]|nr:FAD-dependent oxidoreductase [Chloroflexota bacterium]
MFDIAVIGNGMIGSAATRYLSAMNQKVLAIGPGEPADWQAHQGVFASHYDQGRITRIIDPDLAWAQVAARSIDVYAEIEQASGITFHQRAGGLRVSPDVTAPVDNVNQAEQVGKELGAIYSRLSQAELARQFPFLHFSPGTVGLWERGGAGYINPRSLVQAQLTVAAQQGATIVRETVTGISQRKEFVELSTDAGAHYQARKVLVAAGGYTNHLVSRKLDLRPKAVTVLLGELSEAEVKRLQGLTTLIWRLADHPLLASIYAAPPIRYPDGKMYIKIGGTVKAPHFMHAPEEFRAWFHSAGDSDEANALRDVLLTLLPGLKVESYQTKPCVYTLTAHEHPYIDRLDDQLFVAAGGCGSSAKSSNELGHIAALLVEKGAWNYDIPAKVFEARFK